MVDWVARIPWNELDFENSRSRGPGGQNVNKTNSAVQLRWSLAETEAFSPEQKEKLLARLVSKLTTNGELLIRSEVFRDQDRNRKECLRKLGLLLEQGLRDPKPRKATRPTKSSRRKRLDEKNKDPKSNPTAAGSSFDFTGPCEALNNQPSQVINKSSQS